MDWQVEGGSAGAAGGAAVRTPEAELAARVNEIWFLEPGGEPLTFREVFLRSAALENVVTGAGPSRRALAPAQSRDLGGPAFHAVLDTAPCCKRLLLLRRLTTMSYTCQVAEVVQVLSM